MQAIGVFVAGLSLAPMLLVWARAAREAAARYGRIRAARNRDHASVPSWPAQP